MKKVISQFKWTRKETERKDSSETFCPLPWISSSIRNNGDLRVCCHANASESRGLIINDQTKRPYNANSAELLDVLQSKAMNRIRKNMLEGKTSKECTRCDVEEKVNARSRRKYEGERWQGTFTQKDALSVTNKDGSLKDVSKRPIYYFDLRFGNYCNLACRMCGPADSSGWYSDYYKLTGEKYFHDTHAKIPLELNDRGKVKYDSSFYDWYKSKHFWSQLESLMPSIAHIYMAGGEPLLIDQHYDFLNSCVDKGFAQNIVLEYNTNITHVPQAVIDLWSKFKRVKLGCSVDGYGPVNEYIRYPSKWPIIEKNLDLIDTLSDNIDAWLAMTISNYNIFHLPDFMKWKLGQNYRKINKQRARPLITPHLLHNPKHLSIQSLPRELKQRAADKLESFYPWFDNWKITSSLAASELEKIEREVNRIISSTIKHMFEKDCSKEFSRFVSETKELDKIRGQNCGDFISEYQQYI